jgi:hypothetical protein
MGATMPEPHIALEAGAHVQMPLVDLSHRREREREEVGEVVEREREKRDGSVENYSLRVND